MVATPPPLVTRARRYTRPAKLLHWLMAILVLSQIAVALAMEAAPKDSVEQMEFFRWHASLGVAILLLWPLRVLWRLTHTPPPLPHTIPAVQGFIARQTHYWMYVLLLLLPLTGWAVISTPAPADATLLIGGFLLPPMPGAELLAALLQSVGIAKIGHAHVWLAWTLVVLITLHVAAAALHHFVLRDDVLLRILPYSWHPLCNRLRGCRY